MKLFIMRKSGYLSPYPLSMLYGAAILAPAKFGSAYCPVKVFTFGRWITIPRWIVRLARPFNRYVPGKVSR